MKEQLTYAQRNGATDPSTLKTCKACGKTKVITCFHRARFNLYGVSHECKDCSRDRIRRSHHRRVYGLSEGAYNALLASQGGACALCGTPEGEVTWAGKSTRLPVDHCHQTGKVRGLLCQKCNLRVAVFDDPALEEWMVKARAYLGT